MDVIIELKDGRWGCFEIKLSEEKVADGVKHLIAFRDRLAENEVMKTKPPEFMAVLVGRTFSLICAILIGSGYSGSDILEL